MSRDRAVLEIRLRAEPYGPQYAAELRLEEEAVQAIIERASGRSPNEWPVVLQYAFLAVQQSMLEWARKQFPDRVQREADALALGLMNLQNLHSRQRREEG